MKPWLIAIDGGGSKIAVAATEDDRQAQPRTWHFEGTGSAHPSTWPQAADNLCRALDTVVAELSVTSVAIATIRLALAGAGRSEDQLRVTQTLKARCQSLRDSPLSQVPIVCTGDIDPLVEYQKEGVHCIAVILGTGSVVACRDQSRQLVRAGGWGPLLGDACSGGAIGLSALRYLTQLYDEGRPFDLLGDFEQALLDEMRMINGPHNEPSFASMLIQIASQRTQTARLAGTVLEHAYHHQTQAAQELLEPHVADIVWQIRQVARRASLHNQALQLNFTGGLARHHPELRAAIVQACQTAGLQPLTETLVEPLEAILQQARRRTP